MKIKIGITATLVAVSSIWLGYIVGQKQEHNEQAAFPKWSAWSAPEVIHPTPPFPTWVMQQYRTNLETGEIRVHIMSHGSARTMFDPELVTATE